MIIQGINGMYRQSNIWTALLATVALTLLGSVNLWAQEDEKIDEQLNLTAQQKTEMEALRTKFKSEVAPMKAKLRELQSERRRLESDGADDGDVREVLQQIANQEIEITLLLNQFKKDWLAILTPEQRKKLQELKSKR